MFSPPRDTAMLMDSPAKPLASPSAAEANGPQSQVHAGQRRTSESAAVTTLLRKGFRWCGGEEWRPPRGYPPLWTVTEVYAEAMRLANAEPSVPIAVAEKRPMTCHEYLALNKYVCAVREKEC